MTDIEVQDLGPLHLAGLAQRTTHGANASAEVWRAFGPRVAEITARADTYRYNLRQYPEDLSVEELTADTPFTQWAAVALTNGEESVPDDLEKFRLPGGTYAYYTYRGTPADFGTTLRRVLEEWLPTSGYRVDNSRPHFERLGPDYRPDDPEASEEVFVPVLARPLDDGFAAPTETR